MNSKTYALILALFCSFGCGVKAKPLSPPELAIPSYIETFTDDKETKRVAPGLPNEKKP